MAHNSSWSRDGRYILSSSQDKRVILWDLQDGSRERVVRFEAMVFNAELHPFNRYSTGNNEGDEHVADLDHRNLFVVSLFEDDPHLVDITTTVEVKRRLPTMPLTDDPEAPSLAKLTTTFVLFSYLGNHIFSGTSKGWLNIIETESRNVIFSEKLCNHLIPLLRLSNNGNDLLVNSSDRIIRVINLPDLSRLTPSAAAVFTSNPNTPAAVPTPESAPSPEDISTHLSLNVEHKFQDLVNRLRWNSVAFSSPPTLSATPTSTSDYIVATTYMKKDIYIWERSSGSLVKILEHKEEQGIVEWHPNGRPLIATAGVDSGALNIWAVEPQQKWSALAPDFAEVEENVPLEEREDEFDVLPEAEMRKRRENAEDEDVDIWTVERVKGEEEESFVLPVIFGIQDSDDEEEYVSVGVGTMRRKEANEGREWGEGTVEAG